MTEETLTAEEQAAFAAHGTDPAPAEQPAAQETEAGQQPDAGQPRDDRGKFVPQGALHEERERRKAAEVELRTLREQAARFDERLRVLQEVQQRPAQQAETAPDLATDPVAYIRHLETRLNGVTQSQAEAQQRQQHMSEAQRVLTNAAAAEAEYRAKVPDYADATAHLQQTRAQQLALLGMPPEQVRAAIARDSLEIATHAARTGRNPAEIVYEMAKSIGYQPKAPTTPADGERIATAARGQQLTATLGSGGQAPAGRITAADLLKMSDADFAKAVQTPEGRKLLGG